MSEQRIVDALTRMAAIRVCDIPESLRASLLAANQQIIDTEYALAKVQS